jgi:hypothetical protein
VKSVREAVDNTIRVPRVFIEDKKLAHCKVTDGAGRERAFKRFGIQHVHLSVAVGTKSNGVINDVRAAVGEVFYMVAL